MSKGTTIKEALLKLEEKTGCKPNELSHVKLYAQYPPIEKLDAVLSQCSNCEKLSLSTNCIEKIANLAGFKNLKILSIGRNNIKNLSGLEGVSDSLQQLWISYNQIEKLKGIQVLKKLQVLYISNNLIKDWSEFMRLGEINALQDLLFVGNPLYEKHLEEGNWRPEALKRLPRLRKLDGQTVVRTEDTE